MSTIKEIMNTHAEYMSPNATLKDVAGRMKKLDTGAIPISDDKGEKLIGMVTDRDIVLKAVAWGLDLNTTKAKDVVTSPIIYCFEDQDVSEAAKIMKEKHVRRLVVLNRQKRLVGLISLSDIALKSKDEHLTYDIMSKVSRKQHESRTVM